MVPRRIGWSEAGRRARATGLSAGTPPGIQCRRPPRRTCMAASRMPSSAAARRASSSASEACTAASSSACSVRDRGERSVDRVGRLAGGQRRGAAEQGHAAERPRQPAAKAPASSSICACSGHTVSVLCSLQSYAPVQRRASERPPPAAAAAARACGGPPARGGRAGAQGQRRRGARARVWRLPAKAEGRQGRRQAGSWRQDGEQPQRLWRAG